MSIRVALGIAFGGGCVIGLALLLLSAPLWTFYVAPLAMVPFLIYVLPRLEKPEWKEP